MKRYKILLFGSLLLASGSLMAQDNYTLANYNVTINGTSNLHAWNESVQHVNGKGDVIKDDGKSFTLQAFSILMEVKSIKSTEGSIMDNKTYKALKSDKYPEITFRLADPIADVPHGANGYTVNAKGSLTIAGVTRQIVMPVKVTINGDNKLVVDGSQRVKMTDYNVQPPTAMFGMLKVGDEITIGFKTTFSSIN